MRRGVCVSIASIVWVLSTQAAWGQIATPSAGLRFLRNLLVPNWTTSGATQANSDLFSFNPQTRVMYFADRVNHGVGAIDTRAHTFLGTILPAVIDPAQGAAGSIIATFSGRG